MKLRELVKKKNAKFIIPIVVALVIAVAGTAVISVRNMSLSAKAVETEVGPEVTNVMAQDLQKSISLNGTITALDSQSVASEISGVKINSLKVRVGDRVKKGDVIAVLDTTAIENSLKQAEDALEIAKKKDSLELATAQRNYESALETAKIQIERAEKESQKAENAYNEAVNASNSASAENDTATNNVNDKTAAQNNAKDAVNSAGEEAEKAGEKLVDAQSALSEANTTVEELEKSIASLKEDYTRLVNSDLTDAQKRSNDANTAYKSADERLKKAEENKTALDNNSEATPEQLKDAQDELDKAKTEAATAKGTADEAYRAYEDVKAKADNLKAEIDANETAYKKAVDKRDKKQNKVDKAQKENDNAKNNLETKQNELTEAETALSDAKAKQSEAEAEAKSKKESIENAKDNVEKAKESEADQKREGNKSVADSKDSFSESQLSSGSNTISAQQEVDKYKQELEKATIVAPCDGLVTAVGVKEGAIYDNGNEIARIQDDSGYKVTATVDQYDICNISQGMKVQIKTDSIGDEVMDGNLTFVSPIPGTSDSGSGTSGTSGSGSQGSDYPIEVSINKGFEDRLRIGMTAKITILEEEAKAALTVPDNCVQTADDGTFYVEKAVRDENESVSPVGERITVTYGVKTDYYVEIKGEGLSDGMEILVPAADDFSWESGEGAEQ